MGIQHTSHLRRDVFHPSSFATCICTALPWPLKDPWLGQGSHLQVTGQRRLQHVIHHSCHQPAGRSGPGTWADSEERAGGSQHSRPDAVEGFLSLSSCSYRGPPLLLSFSLPFLDLLFYTSAESCAFQKLSVRPGEIHNISVNFRWNDGDWSFLSL